MEKPSRNECCGIPLKPKYGLNGIPQHSMRPFYPAPSLRGWLKHTKYQVWLVQA
jgi:hypothetical protein